MLAFSFDERKGTARLRAGPRNSISFSDVPHYSKLLEPKQSRLNQNVQSGKNHDHAD